MNHFIVTLCSASGSCEGFLSFSSFPLDIFSHKLIFISLFLSKLLLLSLFLSKLPLLQLNSFAFLSLNLSNFFSFSSLVLSYATLSIQSLAFSWPPSPPMSFSASKNSCLNITTKELIKHRCALLMYTMSCMAVVCLSFKCKF